MAHSIRAHAAILSLSLLVAHGAQASGLQLPHLGGRDAGMSGNVVATPNDGASTLLFNPAGIVGLRGTQVAMGVEAGNVTGGYTNEAIGYDGNSSEVPFAPFMWLSTDRFAPWYVGAGVYGAVGSSFNFPANEEAGLTSKLLGETAVLHLGLVAGREIMPGLRVGVQLAPSYGKLKGRTPSPLGNVAFDVDGFGILGTAGLLYDVTDRTTFGLAYRTPGIVFMSGDGEVAEESDDVEIDLHTPQNLTFGLAHQLTERLLVTVQANWAHYPDFEKGELEFENNPELNQKFIEDTRAVIRYGAGLEYAVLDWAWLRCGVSYEPWMIEPSAIRPQLYDASDFMFMAGFGVQLERWTIDVQTGVGHIEDRVVTEDDQAFFPGRYQSGAMPEFGVSVTYQYDD